MLEKLIKSKLIYFFKAKDSTDAFNKLEYYEKGIEGPTPGTIRLKKSKLPVHHDSGEEIKVLTQLDKCKCVKEIKTQSLKIEYIPTHTKKVKTYYPDIQVLLDGGKLAIIEVKPIHEMINWNVMRKYNALKKYCKENGYACTMLDKDLFTFEDLKKEIVADDIPDKFIEYIKERGQKKRGGVIEISLPECKDFRIEKGITEKQIYYMIWKYRRRGLKYKQYKIIFKERIKTEVGT